MLLKLLTVQQLHLQQNHCSKPSRHLLLSLQQCLAVVEAPAMDTTAPVMDTTAPAMDTTAPAAPAATEAK
jgi:hypothetical protein